MDTVIIPQMEVNTEEDFRRFLELANVEMRHLLARMDERAERSAEINARTNANIKSIEERLRHVQAGR